MTQKNAWKEVKQGYMTVCEYRDPDGNLLGKVETCFLPGDKRKTYVAVCLVGKCKIAPEGKIVKHYRNIGQAKNFIESAVRKYM